MATKKKASKKKTVARKPKAAKKPAAKPRIAKPKAAPAAPKKSSKPPRERLGFAAVMRELEKAGSEQTRKTYARHGGEGPMFGVSFATLKAMMKRIGVDHELAMALWSTGNLDARNLAVKIIDPGRLSSADLDRLVSEGPAARFCGSYHVMLAAETPHRGAKLEKWMRSGDKRERIAAWVLLGMMAQRDESVPHDTFIERLAHVEKNIHWAPNAERDAMNQALVMIGCRNASLRKAALAAAKRIGKVEVDRGDTECKERDATEYIEKAWSH